MGSIVVPSPQQFEIARVEAREAGKSQDLHRMVSAMQAAAAKCALAYEEMVVDGGLNPPDSGGLARI